MKAYKAIKECVISYYSDTILSEFCLYPGECLFILKNTDKKPLVATTTLKKLLRIEKLKTIK